MSIDQSIEGRCGEGTEPCPNLPQRDQGGHKGTFGTVVVVGGCAVMPGIMLGGPVIAARAALRSGCGLAKLAVPEPLIVGALAALPSATGIGLPVDSVGEFLPSECAAVLDEALHRAQALVVGPALGGGFPVEQLVARLLNCAQVPIVLDADALNALCRVVDFHLDMHSARVIMTPHPGEYQRLAAALHLTPEAIVDDASAIAGAAALARRIGCVVVLKGVRTVVSDGVHEWSAHAGTAALATGGSGDALAGLCGGLVAQFHRETKGLSLFDCARLAVAIHGLAARSWSDHHGTAGLLATDLCDAIPQVLDSLRSS